MKGLPLSPLGSTGALWDEELLSVHNRRALICSSDFLLNTEKKILNVSLKAIQRERAKNIKKKFFFYYQDSLKKLKKCIFPTGYHHVIVYKELRGQSQVLCFT